MGKMTHAAAAAALVAIAMAPQTAAAQEAASSPITTTTDDDASITGEAILRVHASTLADGDIKFTELPELGINIDFTDNLRFVLNGNVISPPGENMATNGLDNSSFLFGDAFLRVSVNDATTINVGQFEWAYGQDFGEAWVQSGVGPAAPQILDEPAFAQHGIAQLQGAQVEHTVTLSDDASVYMTGVAGKNDYSGDIQGMGLIRYTQTGADGGSVSLTGQYMSRTGADGDVEQGLFGVLQVRHPVNDAIGVRADLEVGAISNVGGVAGEDGTFIAARGFVDFTHSAEFSSYLGIGAFQEAASDRYAAIEGGAAYKLTDNLTAHAGLGYASGGFAQGLSTMVGLTYTLKFE